MGTPPVGATFTIQVASATDFRGANQLGTGGPETSAAVDTLTYTLTAGELQTSVEQIPYGYTLTFTEADVPASAVAFTPNTGVGNDTGSLLIAPTGTAGGQLITVTNSYTSVVITKALSSAVTLPADTTFPIEYRIDGGPVQTATVAVGASGTFTISGVPWGSEVKVREPLEGPFSWGGWIWRTGTWTDGATELVPDVDGWVTVTAGTFDGSARAHTDESSDRAARPPVHGWSCERRVPDLGRIGRGDRVRSGALATQAQAPTAPTSAAQDVSLAAQGRLSCGPSTSRKSIGSRCC